MMRPQKGSEAELLRLRVAKLLAETDGWNGYEDQRKWLEALLDPEHGDAYSLGKRAAVNRIIIARTLFDAWSGYSISEKAQPLRVTLSLSKQVDCPELLMRVTFNLHKLCFGTILIVISYELIIVRFTPDSSHLRLPQHVEKKSHRDVILISNT